MNDHPITDEPGAGHYEIRLAGQLDPTWAEWLDAQAVLDAQAGMTVIRTGVLDQAALHGLLQRIRDLGLPLVSVTRLTDDQH
jgi:hypothetical protein